jgi:hypothetical protein
LGGFGGFCCRVSDVNDKLIVTADMLADSFESHKDRALRPGSLEKQQSTTALEWIPDLQPATVPALPLVKGLVRIDCVISIEAVRNFDLLPHRALRHVLTPYIPDSSQGSSKIFPPRGQLF